MEVGVVGAGLMGHGMAVNLLRHGHGVRVIAHRNRAPVDDLVGQGAAEVQSMADLAKGAQIILLCVSNSRAVEEAIAKLKPHLMPGMTVLDAGTSEPGSTRKIADQLHAMGVGFADIPVTGGPDQAEKGELGVLCGTNPETFRRISPVLSCFASTIRHMGEAGSGHTAKLISNYLVTGMVALVAEAFMAASKARIDWRDLYEAMQNGSGNSGVLRKMIGPALDGDFDGYRFSLANAAKDINAYNMLAEELSCRSNLSDAVARILNRAVESGQGERNVSRLLIQP